MVRWFSGWLSAALPQRCVGFLEWDFAVIRSSVRLIDRRGNRMRHAMAGWLLCGLVGGFAMTVAAQTAKDSGAGLAGTSWRLVEFRGGDDTVLTPDDKDRYTLAFAGNVRVSVRVDCNHGFATWNSEGPGQIKFGPMGLTRMMCPPAALSDNIVKQ